jgi:hypothetical protein
MSTVLGITSILAALFLVSRYSLLGICFMRSNSGQRNQDNAYGWPNGYQLAQATTRRTIESAAQWRLTTMGFQCYPFNLQQARACVILVYLCVTDVTAQSIDGAMPAYIHHFEDRGADVRNPARKEWPANRIKAGYSNSEPA